MRKLIAQGILFFLLCSSISTFQLLRLSILYNENENIANENALAETDKFRKKLNLRKLLPRVGFNNIHANLTFINFLQYFGNDELRNQNGYDLSPEFFESIITNDPYYIDFYVFLTNSVSLNAARPEQSADLLNKGLASLEENRLDDSFYVWRYKGVDELLFLNDARSAKYSFRKAAEWASESSLPESDFIASISQQTADFIEQNPNSKAAQIGAWSSVLTTAIDHETRGRAIQGIQALGGEVVIDENGGVTVKYAQGEQNTEG
ncbi:MAG: hypothetical protein AAFQ95_11800 [Cyanobacteria bacterium J06621_3]